MFSNVIMYLPADIAALLLEKENTSISKHHINHVSHIPGTISPNPIVVIVMKQK